MREGIIGAAAAALCLLSAGLASAQVDGPLPLGTAACDVQCTFHWAEETIRSCGDEAWRRT